QFGPAHFECRLTPIGDPTMVVEWLMAHEGALPAVALDQKEKQKPEIVLVPEPARVLEGETARFRCRVTGYPMPKVNWYLNGQLIRKSKRFRLRYDGIYYLDIVDYVTADDSASIMVKAVNIAGETSSHENIVMLLMEKGLNAN
uniref:Ig-like domain-containing protein n=1 Tax=Zosterops lateralis melanops TaxID=1220523 RepID=A0A8D2NPJ3_ZOSLA